MLIADILRIKNQIIKNWVVIEIVKYKILIDTIYLSLMNIDVTQHRIVKWVLGDLKSSIRTRTEPIT